MNKRGDMPTYLIVVMALVLVGIALFSFVSFKDNLQKQSIDFSRVQGSIEMNYNYVLKSAELIGGKAIMVGSADLRQNFIDTAKERDIQLYGSGNFFGKVAAGNFTFGQSSGNFVLNVHDLIVFAELNGNKIRRNFNIEMTFDSSGNLLTKKITYNS